MTHKFSKAEWDKICVEYQRGEGIPDLARRYSLSTSSVWSQLVNRGIPRRDRSTCRRIYRCNHSFFSTIETEEKAYWLGFIAADGYVQERPNGILIVQLALQDLFHLERMKQSLQSNHRIIFPRRRSEEHPQARLAITSPQIVHDLVRLGLTQAKTFTVGWPAIPAPLLRHYLRGYVDGDGCFHIQKRTQTLGTLSFSLMSTPDFLCSCRAFLMKQCDLKENKISPHQLTPGIAELRYGGNQQVWRIYHLLYDGATIYLPRKKCIVESCPPRPDNTWPTRYAKMGVTTELIASVRDHYTAHGGKERELAKQFGIGRDMVRSILGRTPSSHLP